MAAAGELAAGANAGGIGADHLSARPITFLARRKQGHPIWGPMHHLAAVRRELEEM
jgi:hypothetical protein